MPVTPRFTLLQDGAHVTLVVRVPYVRVGDAEVLADGCELSFYCRPYLLQLTLPAALAADADERASCVYDPDDAHGTLRVTLPKAQAGEHFADLDLVTRLLQPRAAPPSRRAQASGPVDMDLRHIVAQPSSDDEEADSSGGGGRAEGGELLMQARMEGLSMGGVAPPRGAPTARARPLIEVLHEEGAVEAEGLAEGAARVAAAEGGASEASGLRERAPHKTDDSPKPSSAGGSSSSAPEPFAATAPTLLSPSARAAPLYGFNRSACGVFSSLREEMPGLTELPSPDETPAHERRALREAMEDAQFQPQRYLDDNAEEAKEDSIYAEAVTLAPWWLAAGGGVGEAGGWIWQEEEMDELRALPNKEFLLDGVLYGGRRRAGGVQADEEGGREAAGLPRGDATDPAGTLPPLCPDAQPESTRALVSLVPLLAAYAYDTRCTGGDPTCESGWTIFTLTPLLSWLDDDVIPCEPFVEGGGALGDAMSPRAVLIAAPRVAELGLSVRGESDASARGSAPAATSLAACLHVAAAAFMRRALVRPYLRRWDLAHLALCDAACMLAGGVRPTLRALLAARRTLRGGDLTAVLAALYLDDAVTWLQSAPEGWLRQAGVALQREVLGALDAPPRGAAALTKEAPALAAWGIKGVEEEA